MTPYEEKLEEIESKHLKMFESIPLGIDYHQRHCEFCWLLSLAKRQAEEIEQFRQNDDNLLLLRKAELLARVVELLKECENHVPRSRVNAVEAEIKRLQQLRKTDGELIKELTETVSETARAEEELEATITQLQIKVRAADVMAKIADDWVDRKLIDARSALADARLDYGDPRKYEAKENEQIADLKVELSKMKDWLAFNATHGPNCVLDQFCDCGLKELLSGL